MTPTPATYARPSIAPAVLACDVACCTSAALATGARYIVHGDTDAGLRAIEAGCMPAALPP